MTRRQAGESAGAVAGAIVVVAADGSPLGHAVARAARDRGADVGLAMLEPQDAEAAADALIDDAASRHDRMSALVLVVDAPPIDALHGLTIEHWRAAVTDPLRRVFWLVRRAIEESLAGGGGLRIVLVPDAGSRAAYAPDAAAHTAGNADSGSHAADGAPPNEAVAEALCSLARSIAREYGRRDVACNVVLPVPAARGAAAGTAGAADATEREIRGPADVVVEHALFLASPAASFVNGEAVRVAVGPAAGGGPIDGAG